MQQPAWTDKPAANLVARGGPVRLIVLHDTCGAGTHADTEYLAHPGDGRAVSVDFTVEKDGSIWKLNPQLEEYSCWHAGRATKWGDLVNGEVNHASIGIEIVQREAKAEYSPAQVDAVARLCAWLCERFKLPGSAITTHAAIITDGSRDDPREFPFDAFWLAFYVASGAPLPPVPTVEAMLAASAPAAPPPAPAAPARPAPPAAEPHLEVSGAVTNKLAKILDAARRGTAFVDTGLRGLEWMVRAPGFLAYCSKLDLDTDGKTEEGLEYEPTHQDETSLPGIDSNVVPYYVLPGGFAKSHDIKLGDIAAVLWGDRLEFALFADTGSRNKIGEGSLALHRALGFERIRDGVVIDAGVPHGVVTVVFPGSGDGTAQTPERVREIGRARFVALGGRLA